MAPAPPLHNSVAAANPTVEQQAELALEVSDRVYVIDRGELVHEGGSAPLLADTAQRKALTGV